MRGKLIVFEGTDGSGKATQSRLLCERLARENIPYQHINFPRYGKPSAAMVQEYLDGNLGKHPGDVNAYAASLFYAMDRYASYKQDWGPFYEAGGLVVADRYTTSNAVHQASKLLPGERKDFLRWLFDTEYRLMGLPEPDLVLYLDMPTEITEKMMRQREAATGTHADIHEADTQYLSASRRMGRSAAEYYGWTLISCVEKGKMRSIQDIHEEIYRYVTKCLEE